MGKIRIAIDADPDVKLFERDVRARIVKAVEAQLGFECDHEHEDLEKALKPKARQLPHKYPQSLIEDAVERSERVFAAMIDEIAEVLAE